MPDTSHTIVAESQDAGQRLDRFLASRLPEMSRSRLQGLIAQGCLFSKGAPVEDASAKIRAGQEFLLLVPEAVPSHIEPQQIALDIIYEDEHLLIINKQAGLTVHPAPGNHDRTLVNALLAHCGDSLSGIGGVARPGIVHRIDKDTTGLLVVAKHDAAHIALSAQLADRSLKRVYDAIVWGAPENKQGTVKGNIGRSISNRQKMAVLRSGGKPAVTHYKMQEIFTPAALKKPLAALVECQLETGRTHQIRVHLTHIGHPLLGDATYGQSTQSRLNAAPFKSLPEPMHSALLSFRRQALHAKSLTLIHPASQKPMRFEAKPPEDMLALLQALREE